jgi:hypothetical protein
MRWLGLALVAEGPTDERFLGPLLRRAVVEACLDVCRSEVEVGDVAPVRWSGPGRPPLADFVLESAQRCRETAHILFIHTDGGGDPDRARRERFSPALERVAAEEGLPHMVAVIPVRETEAWLLADGDAIRNAFGTTIEDARLGLPGRPTDVERVPDPKALLDHVIDAARGGRSRGARPGASPYFDVLGERVRLDSLRQLPAFRRFESDLRAALADLC